jgi:hypothetical protein
VSVLELDFYDKDDPNGASLGQLTEDDLEAFKLRWVYRGVGAFEFTSDIRAIDATLVEPQNVCKVTIPVINDDPILGYLMEGGRVKLTDEHDDLFATFSGPGTLAILRNARLPIEPTAPGQPFRGDATFDNVWWWRGEPYGAIIVRGLEEGQNDLGSGAPLQHVTWDFTRNLDSTSNGWNEVAEEYETRIGRNLLDHVLDMQDAGELVLTMDAHLQMRAFQTYGTDRTSTTFAAGKVRLTPENTVTGLERTINGYTAWTHVTVESKDGTYLTRVSPDYEAGTPARIGYVKAEQTNDPILMQKIGDYTLLHQRTGLDTIEVEVTPGDDELNGYYLPHEHYKPGDRLTVYTGTGPGHYNNRAVRLTAVRIELADAVDDGSNDKHHRSLRVILELNGVTTSDGAFDPGSSAGTRDGCGDCPPAPRPCRALVTAAGDALRFYHTAWECGDVSDGGAWSGDAPGGKAGHADWDEDPRIAFAAYMLHPEPQSSIATRHTPWAFAGAGAPTGASGDILLDQYWLPLTESGLPNPLGGYVRSIAQAYGRSGIGVSELDQSLLSQMAVRIYRPGTASFVATLLAPQSIALIDGPEWRPADGTEVEDARWFPVEAAWDDAELGAALTSTAWVDGDYLVVEYGARNFQATDTTGASVWLDDTAASDAAAEGDHDLRSWIEFATGDTTTGGGALEELVGTEVGYYARCDHRHHVVRAVDPTPDDDAAHGYPEGTQWVVVDDVDAPTVIVSIWRSFRDDEGNALWLIEPGSSSTPSSGEQLVDLPISAAPLGGWNVNIGGPNVVQYGGRSYVGGVKGSNGDAYVQVVSHLAGERAETAIVLHAALDADTHASPVFLVRESDHKLLTWYSAHNGAALYQRVSVNSLDDDPFLVGGFAAEVNLDASLTGTAYTYPSPVQLDTGIMLTFRYVTGAAGQDWGYSISSDDGATWPALTKFYEEAGRWGYVKSVRNSGDRVDFLVQDGSIANGDADTSIRHCYYDASANTWHKSDGTSAGALPLDASDMTLVHNGAGGDPASLSDVACDDSGRPFVAFRTWDNATTDHYWWGYWSGSAWVVDEFAAGGYFGLNYTSGGIALDARNPTIAYASLLVDGVLELFRYRTRDRGATWETTQLTSESTAHNLYPVSPLDRGAAEPVFWMAEGSYTNATTYNVGTHALYVGQAEPEPHTHPASSHVHDDYLTEAEHALVDHTGLPGVGSGSTERRILIADGHATPFVFTDLLQADDGSDFLWTDSE